MIHPEYVAPTRRMLSSLQTIACALYSTVKGSPFELNGTCRALVYHEHGIPTDKLCIENGYIFQRENLKNTSVEKLVWVKMLAAPVNPADINQIQGTYPLEGEGPSRVGGNEGVGIVVKAGNDITTLKCGDWVIPRTGAFGTWREQVICTDTDLQSIPSDLPLDVAATLLVNPTTAYRLLNDFVSLSPGDVIVQNGANSAVGRYIIQMAHKLGVKTVNIIRDRPYFESVESELFELGATIVVKSTEFSKEDTQSYLITTLLGGQRPILGLNCTSGVATAEMARFLAQGSPLVTYGGMSGKNPVVSASALIFREIRFLGFWMSLWYEKARENASFAHAREKMFSEIIKMFRDGTLLSPKVEKFSFPEGWKDAIERYTNFDNTNARTSDAKPLLIMKQ